MDPADLVTLNHSNGSSLVVHLFGATVVSWRSQGEERIFISSKSLFDNKKAIRGGIPVVFPNFGPWECGPQHGFARINRWHLDQQPSKDAENNEVAVFTLVDNEASRAMWNFRFELKYTVTLKAEGFTTAFQVKNTDSKEFDFTCLLHTYFKVPDVKNVKVTGLHGLTYTDKVLGGTRKVEDREDVTVTEDVDRVYEKTPNEHIIWNTAGGSKLRLVKTNLPDTVVWNPWRDKAAAMADFGDNDYPEMICVEAGYVANRKSLSAGQTCSSSQSISIAQ